MLFELFETIDILKSKISSLEKEVKDLKKKQDLGTNLLRSNLTRLKNKEELNNLMIMGEISYEDLSPKQAVDIYRNQDKEFQILDITEVTEKENISLDDTLHIPFSELTSRLDEIKNKTVPLLVISQSGLKSILACEMLSKKGFLNVKNVSGGYLLWGKSSDNQFKVVA